MHAAGRTICGNCGFFYWIHIHINFCSKLSCSASHPFSASYSIFYLTQYIFQVQGLVNTFGDLRGAFAATERINSVLSGAEIDEALAYGLERDIKNQEVHDKNFGLFINGYDINNQSLNMHYMSALKSTSSLGSLAWSGDVCLEGIFIQFTFFFEAR